MDMDNVRACPFCGTQDDVEAAYSEEDECYYVQCLGCNAAVANVTMVAAVTTWNTRNGEEPTPTAGTIQ